jgi:hypothetical protein
MNSPLAHTLIYILERNPTLRNVVRAELGLPPLPDPDADPVAPATVQPPASLEQQAGAAAARQHPQAPRARRTRRPAVSVSATEV